MVRSASPQPGPGVQLAQVEKGELLGPRLGASCLAIHGTVGSRGHVGFREPGWPCCVCPHELRRHGVLMRLCLCLSLAFLPAFSSMGHSRPFASRLARGVWGALCGQAWIQSLALPLVSQ